MIMLDMERYIMTHWQVAIRLLYPIGMNLIFDVVQNHYLYRNGIFKMCMVKLCKNVHDYMLSSYQTRIIHQLHHHLDVDSYMRYETLFFRDKEGTSPTNFVLIIQNAQSAITSLITWGIPCIIDTFVSIISLRMIVYQIWREAIFISVVYALYYIYYHKGQDVKYQVLRNDINKQLSLLQTYIYRTISLMIGNDTIADDVLQILNRRSVLLLELSSRYNRNNKTQIVQTLCMLIVFYGASKLNDGTTYLLILQLSWSVQSLFGFMHQYNTLKADWEVLSTYWDDKTHIASNKPTKSIVQWEIAPFSYKITEQITIRLSCKLNIYQGHKIRIYGTSGSGKTQFMNIILGKYPYKFDRVDAIECYQTIRDTLLNCTVLTPRQVMMDELDDNLIRTIFRIVELDDRIPYDQYDKQVVGLSGGERMRLSLANRIWYARNRAILVLDEPDQGLDQEMACRILQNIMTYMSEKTIFCILHVGAFEYPWDIRLNVDKGIVSQLDII